MNEIPFECPAASARQAAAADRQNIAALAGIQPETPLFPCFHTLLRGGNANWHGFCEYQAGSPAGDAIKGKNGRRSDKFSKGHTEMPLEDSLFGVHGKALALRSQRLSLLASNIANASTPGYKARDIDFEAALKQATSTGGSATAAIESAMGYRVPLQSSLDGNTVELSTEQTLFAENAVKYRTTLSFLEGRINTINRALKGE